MQIRQVEIRELVDMIADHDDELIINVKETASVVKYNLE